MSKVIEKFARLVSPLGPGNDNETRDAEENEWLDSISIEQTLELLEWIRHPIPLPGWSHLTEDDIPGLQDMAAGYVGSVARRNNDKRLRQALESLLTNPVTRAAAVYGLEILGKQVSVSKIGAYVDDQNVVTAKQIAFSLGELGGAEALALLEKMQKYWRGRDSQVQRTIEESLRQLGKSGSDGDDF